MLVQLFQEGHQGGRVGGSPGDDVGLLNEAIAGQEGGIVLQFGLTLPVVAVSGLQVVGAGNAVSAFFAVRSLDDAAFVRLLRVGGEAGLMGTMQASSSTPTAIGLRLRCKDLERIERRYVENQAVRVNGGGYQRRGYLASSAISSLRQGINA